MPDDAVYVGRLDGTLHWGNPVRVGMYFMVGNPEGSPLPLYCAAPMPSEGFTYVDSAATAVALFRQLIDRGYFSKGSLELLRGKNLACWCPLDQPCHADVLLELANRPLVTNGSCNGAVE